MTLHLQWLAAKAAEAQAVETRREIEDQLTAQMGIKPDADGVTTIKVDGYVIKATSRLNRKIDADVLQELAAANGIDAHLSTLFRWKPEISMTAWKAASDDITGPLLPAITTTPGRPSFSITLEPKKDESK